MRVLSTIALVALLPSSDLAAQLRTPATTKISGYSTLADTSHWETYYIYVPSEPHQNGAEFAMWLYASGQETLLEYESVPPPFRFTLHADTLRDLEVYVIPYEGMGKPTRQLHRLSSSAGPIALKLLYRDWHDREAYTYYTMPQSSWGKEYVLAGAARGRNPTSAGEYPPSVIIIAHEDSTIVTITPRVPLIGVDSKNKPLILKAFEEHTVMLDGGSAIEYVTDPPQIGGDLSGTHITASNPIGVISSARSYLNPFTDEGMRDWVCDMMLPRELWGKEYYTAPFAERNRDVFLMIGSEDAQIIACTDAKGRTRDILTGKNQPVYLDSVWASCKWSSSHPFMLAHYVICEVGFDSTLGKQVTSPPGMYVVQPKALYTDDILFITTDTTSLTVVTSASVPDPTRLDGWPLKGEVLLDDGVFKTTRVERVKPGLHSLRSRDNATVSIYSHFWRFGYASPGALGIHTPRSYAIDSTKLLAGISGSANEAANDEQRPALNNILHASYREGKLQLDLPPALAGALELTVTDAVGRPLLTTALEGQAGIATSRVAMPSLPRGAYFSRVTDGKQTLTARFIVSE